MASYVYFIYDPFEFLIKIGIAVKPRKRLKELERELKTPLDLLAVIPGGDEHLERELHSRFAQYNAHRDNGIPWGCYREWFFPKADILHCMFANAELLYSQPAVECYLADTLYYRAVMNESDHQRFLRILPDLRKAHLKMEAGPV